ncbi:FAD/NAD(P)-binding domain-containing protein [Xylariaceae sp. FL0662B]|nr:FAD/NAD(P)-binding domain-containing protein [Xylariaceae sp. FL0662B]
MSGSSTIRVAIIGGKLAGALALRGLLRYSHLAVDIYESRPLFKEEGPALALTRNTQAILQAIDPELDQCLERAGAVLSSSETLIATGPHLGCEIVVNGPEEQDKKLVDRQAFLTELLNGIPPRMMHINARIASVTELPGGGGVLLSFADGSQEKYDVVIGADGIHGIMREVVFGRDESLVKPEATGFWGLPITVPHEKAQEAMGTEYLDLANPCQTTWIGNRTIMQPSFVNHGKEVQIVVYGTGCDDDQEDNQSGWVKLFTPEEFREIFAGNQIPLIESLYTVQVAGICQLQHRPAPTYATANVCLIGDSAQSMLPFQDASTTIAIEQAFILSTLLGRLSSKAAIPAALQAFDQVCRPRAEHAARSSFEAGYLMTGQVPGVGLDATLLQRALQHKWGFLRDFDIEARRAAAIDFMDRFLGTHSWH